jgi:polyisoprenyl-phosphate glycosyltransferase
MKIDFVIPLFNEQESLPDFHRNLAATVLPESYSRRYIYINDGSTDATQTILRGLAKCDSNIVALELSRNFGHQAALSAGLDEADGDVVIMMDGDGQHPPSLVPDMLRLFEGGCDIVQAQRLDEARSGGFFKRVSSRWFYRLLRAVGEVELIEGASDFRLFSRRAVEALRGLPEYDRFLRGMTAWIGFTTAVLPYPVLDRIGGRSKYSLRKMFRLAGDGLFSFSLVPLRIGLFLGLGFVLTATVELIYIAAIAISGHRDRLIPGWSSLVLILTVSSAINMILQGILGVYVGMIFREVKRRPIYLIQSRTGGSEPE